MDDTKARQRGGWGRWVLFRVAGVVVVVLLPLAAVEVAVRLFVAAPGVDFEDPYVSFSGQSRLFVLDSIGERFEIAEERLTAFRPQSFAAKKGEGALRIFCLGGSMVQGRPYSVETSFTSWLKLSLDAARPGRENEVVNCGGVSYASYRLVPIMAELVGYEPDLFIIYTGHNEFLEDRTYARVKKMPRAAIWAHRMLLNLRSYSVANRYLSRVRRTGDGGRSKTVLGGEIETKLDFEEGLKSYHHDEAWRRGIIEHFRRNLETMVRASRGARVPVILVNPVSNLKDCPPFKSEFGGDTTEEQKRRVAELREEAGKLDWADTYGKIGLLEQAAAIDDHHAEVLYLLGRCYVRIGRFGKAKEWFVRAKEEDVCPLRMVSAMHEAVMEVAGRYDAGLVDAKALIEGRSEGEIAGDEWLLDHVHPSIAGHKLIAEALWDAMEEMNLVRGADGWRAVRDELWGEHLSSLDDIYHAMGTVRLNRLLEWSRGRMPKE